MIRQKDLFLEKSLEIGWRSLLTSSISSVLVASVVAVDSAIIGSIAISGVGCSSVYVIAKAAFEKLSPLNRLTSLVVSVALAMFVIFSSLSTFGAVMISAKVAVCLGGLHFLTNLVLSSLISVNKRSESSAVENPPPSIEKAFLSTKNPKEKISRSYKWMKEAVAKKELLAKSLVIVSSALALTLISYGVYSFVHSSLQGSDPSPNPIDFSGNTSTNTSSQCNDTLSVENLSQQISNATSGINSEVASTSSSTMAQTASESISGSSLSGVQTVVSNEISKLDSASTSSLVEEFPPRKRVQWELIGLGMTATAVVAIGLFALRAALLKRRDQTAIVVPKAGSEERENAPLLQGENDSSSVTSDATSSALKIKEGGSSSNVTKGSALVSSLREENFPDGTLSQSQGGVAEDPSSDASAMGGNNSSKVGEDPSFTRYTEHSPSPGQSPSRGGKKGNERDDFDLLGELSSIRLLGEEDNIASVSAALFPYEAFQGKRCKIVPLTEIQPYPIWEPPVHAKAARGSLNHSATAKQVSLRQDAQPSEGEEIGVYIKRVFSSYQAPEEYPRGFVISVPSISLKISPHPLIEFFTKYSELLETCGITRIYLEEILGADIAVEEKNLPYKYHQYFQEEQKEPPQKNPILKALFPLAKKHHMEVAGLRVKLSGMNTIDYHCETEKAKNLVSYGAGLIFAEQEPFIAFVTTPYAKGTNNHPGFSQLLGCPSIGMRAIPTDVVQNGIHGYGSTAYSVDARFST